jgi:hypothetical protein
MTAADDDGKVLMIGPLVTRPRAYSAMDGRVETQTPGHGTSRSLLPRQLPAKSVSNGYAAGMTKLLD